MVALVVVIDEAVMEEMEGGVVSVVPGSVVPPEKVAVTVRLDEKFVNVQTFAAGLGQLVHEVKVLPEAGIAVSTIDVPLLTTTKQVLPQSSEPPPEVTVPLPFPFFVTKRVAVVDGGGVEHEPLLQYSKAPISYDPFVGRAVPTRSERVTPRSF